MLDSLLGKSESGEDPLIPLSWVRELLTSHEAVDRIADVLDGAPSGVTVREGLAHALPFLGHVLEDRARRGVLTPNLLCGEGSSA